MSAGAEWDWIYPIAGWTLGAAAALLLAWALLWDRSRGRRRCPKCWYDMSGTPGLRCPECGREFGQERKLLRTRRRKRWIPVVALLGLAAYVVASVPRWRDGGWTAIVPTTSLVYLAPPAKSSRPNPMAFIGMMGKPPPPPKATTRSQALADELFDRLGKGGVAQWQARVFLRRCLTHNGLDLSSLASVPARWPVDERIPVRFSAHHLGELVSVLKDDHGVWGSDEIVRLPARPPGRHHLRLELGFQSGEHVYRTHRQVPIVVEGTRENVLLPMDSSATNEMVRRALEPCFVKDGERTILIVRDRSDENPWTSMNFGLAFTFEVRVDGELIMTGAGTTHWAKPEPQVPDRVDWQARAADPRLRPGANATITVRGDRKAATADYLTWPFERPAACWTGEFSVPLEFKAPFP